MLRPSRPSFWIPVFIAALTLCLFAAGPDSLAQQAVQDDAAPGDEAAADEADDDTRVSPDDQPATEQDDPADENDDALGVTGQEDTAESRDDGPDDDLDDSDDSDFESEPVSEDADADVDAAEQDTDEDWEDVYEATDCPALFGGDDLHATNAHRREDVLGRVRGQRRVVTVVHHARWHDEPVRLRIRGIELEDIERDEDSGKWLALVDVADAVAQAYQCQPGLYQIRQDDNLFPNVRVLVVKRGFVLTESYGHLSYIPVDGFTQLTFRMIWQSEWTIPRPKEGVKSKARGKSSRKKKRRKRSKRRRR